MAAENKIISIALTGPESSGKSFTAEYLARFFDGWVVPEFAREYLEQLDRAYQYQDIVNIARAQIDIEQKVTADAVKEEVDLIFFDNELINTQIWAEEKYGQADPLIQQGIVEANHTHYLLMKPDIPWEADPLRENPTDRDRLFQLHINYLEKFNKPYTVIEGELEKRLKLAVAIVKTWIA
jgi:NadR type nicotinamide-nucleotide adenylyltransferase